MPYSSPLPHHQFISLFQILSRDGPVQFPGNIHGPRALMFDVIGQAKECVGYCSGNIIPEFTHKQQHLTTSLAMVDIALPGWGCVCGCTLTLPMKQPFVDGIIIVYCDRHVVLFSLIKCDKGLTILVKIYPAANLIV